MTESVIQRAREAAKNAPWARTLSDGHRARHVNPGYAVSDLTAAADAAMRTLLTELRNDAKAHARNPGLAVVPVRVLDSLLKELGDD